MKKQYKLQINGIEVYVGTSLLGMMRFFHTNVVEGATVEVFQQYGKDWKILDGCVWHEAVSTPLETL